MCAHNTPAYARRGPRQGGLAPRLDRPIARSISCVAARAHLGASANVPHVSVPSIVVVANKHRPALVLESLDGIAHVVSSTPDYELPSDFATGISLAAYNHVGAYRCFRGHQDALDHVSGDAVRAIGRDAVRVVGRDAVLVLEDDAVPNTPDWLSIVESAAATLADFEVISLHGRGFDPAKFERRAMVERRDVLVPRFSCGPVRVFGSLAYLIREKAMRRFMAMVYDGVPVDLLLPNRFKFCLLNPSPFDHDRRYPSLVG